MDVELPSGYRARAYLGPQDHPTMASILGAYNLRHSDGERPTAEQFDSTYANLDHCDPYRDAVIVETVDGTPVGYGRTYWNDTDDGIRSWVPFAVLHPDRVTAALYTAFIRSLEAHATSLPDHERRPDRYLAFAPHPGPGLPPEGESSWLESLDYSPVRFEAALVRPNLDDIADLALPDGVEIRPVRAEQIRQIWEAHHEAFRGQWDFHEVTENEFQSFLQNPRRDESLWKVAWAGDEVVGQVKTFVLDEENEMLGRLRGYTEEISTHADWRGRGIAGALLCASLRELHDRGFTEAALGADTDNPAAYGLYQRLGFAVIAFAAVYAKPFDPA
jgi:mycothiol synthase